MPLSLRPAFSQDQRFLYDLIYTHIADVLQASLWDPAIQQPLLDLQVRSKENTYGMMHPHADHAVIVLDDEPVGRMIIDRSGEFYDLVDIVIAAKHRSSGIGTRLLIAISMEAAMMKKNVRLHVSVTNPRAISLYRRLGFHVIEGTETDLLMEKTPADQSQVVAAT